MIVIAFLPILDVSDFADSMEGSVSVNLEACSLQSQIENPDSASGLSPVA
jgi:hypothetical protein